LISSEFLSGPAKTDRESRHVDGFRRIRPQARLDLFLYPVTRGGGPRVFPEGIQTTLSLTDSRTYDNGVVYLQYRSAA
jgi:hypothetical protein